MYARSRRRGSSLRSRPSLCNESYFYRRYRRTDIHRGTPTPSQSQCTPRHTTSARFIDPLELQEIVIQFIVGRISDGEKAAHTTAPYCTSGVWVSVFTFNAADIRSEPVDSEVSQSASLLRYFNAAVSRGILETSPNLRILSNPNYYYFTFLLI